VATYNVDKLENICRSNFANRNSSTGKIIRFDPIKISYSVNMECTTNLKSNIRFVTIEITIQWIKKSQFVLKFSNFSVTIISLRVWSTPGRLYNEREIFFLSLKEDLKKEKKKISRKKICFPSHVNPVMQAHPTWVGTLEVGGTEKKLPFQFFFSVLYFYQQTAIKSAFSTACSLQFPILNFG
jgi:hypothetical protein